MKLHSGLSMKIFIGCILCIFIPLTVIGVQLYEKSTTILEKQLLANSMEALKNYDVYYLKQINVNLDLFINLWADRTDLESIKQNKADRLKYENEWKAALMGYPEVDSIIYADDTGWMFEVPERPLPEDYDPRKRPWYLDAMNASGRVSWSQPFKSASYEEWIYTLSKTVSDKDGNSNGVIAITVKLSAMSDLLNEVGYGRAGYLVLVDSTGRIISSPHDEQIGGSIATQNWSKSILESESGTTSVDIDGIQYYVSHVTNVQTGWKLIGFMPRSDLAPKLSLLQKLMQNTAMNLVIWGVFVILALWSYSNRIIVKPLQRLMALMDRAKDGDMTVSDSVPYKRRDEIGKLHASFEQMIQGQRDILIQVLVAAVKLKGMAETAKGASDDSFRASDAQNDAMEDMSGAIGDMSTSVAEIMERIERIADNLDSFSLSMQDMGMSATEIAESMVDTTESIADALDSLKQFNTSITSISRAVEVVKRQGRTAVNRVDHGQRMIEESLHEISKVNMSMVELSGIITRLNGYATRIGEINDVMEDMANQTNLLSLNASIEAARAGEYGKGFSVVATAIGALADKTKVSTKDIEKMTAEIRSTVSQAYENTMESNMQLERSIEQSRQTEHAFADIQKSINETVFAIEEIASSIKEQEKSARSISDVAERVNQLTSQVSVANESQLATVEELISTTEDLSSLTREVSDRGTIQAADLEEIAATSLDVSGMAADVKNNSAITSKSSIELLDQAEQLVGLTSRFKL